MRLLRLMLIIFTLLTVNALAQTAQYLPVDPYPLVFKTEKGNFKYQVEIAKTHHEQEQGLMYRTVFPRNRAMFFMMGPDAIGVWMKDTPIPLDIVFIDRDGRVVSIAYNAVPYSQVIIKPAMRTRYSIEVNAGEALRMNLRPGDCVQHPILPKACSSKDI